MELPALPDAAFETDAYGEAPRNAIRGDTRYFTADQMRAYAQECAQAAVEAALQAEAHILEEFAKVKEASLVSFPPGMEHKLDEPFAKTGNKSEA